MAARDGERDLIGYGRSPPDPRWPGGARLAVNFVLNIEEGSEYTVGDGDGFSEVTLTDMPASPVPHGERDLAAESLFEYGSRAGVWRVLRLFEERGLPITLYACALAIERNPELAAAIRDGGHDVCCHGWRWIEHYKLSEDVERQHISKAIESLERTTGRRPRGWCCRYGPSVNTRRLLVEAGGFLYDSDAYNDDLPYWVEVGGSRHLVVPYTHANNDSKFGRGPFATGGDFEVWHRDAFDFLLAEGRTAPKMMSVGLHSRLIGHPARAAALARLLDHVTNQRDAWVARRIDIAEHWHAQHSPPGAAR